MRKNKKSALLAAKKVDYQFPTGKCHWMRYNEQEVSEDVVTAANKVVWDTTKIHWLNLYGFEFNQGIRTIVEQNSLDEFIVLLTVDQEHRNKAIELKQGVLFTIKSPIPNLKHSSDLAFEQMVFILDASFVWSIQEQEGDHFENLRHRIRNRLGIVRRKGTDYLFYLLIETVINAYHEVYELIVEENKLLKDFRQVRATPEYVKQVEACRNTLYQIKKMVSNLRDALGRLEKMDLPFFNPKYAMELREQVSWVSDEIDFNLQQLESSINLVINIQNNRLNEVMKTLTILSVIFIPLTFLAGIYGMNFKHMPELDTPYGYQTLLGVMVVITLGILYYFKRNNWFK